MEQFKTQHQKHYANDAEEVERYGFFKKLKARVTKHDDQSKNIIMKERFWIKCAVSEIVLQPLEPDTDTSKLHVKRIIAVQEETRL